MRTGRSPHGERGLKCNNAVLMARDLGRSPHGERGLKSCRGTWRTLRGRSLSSRRAWIEMLSRWRMTWTRSVALLTESVD